MSGRSVFSGHDKLCQTKTHHQKKQTDVEGIYFPATSGQFGTYAHEVPVLNLQPDPFLQSKRVSKFVGDRRPEPHKTLLTTCLASPWLF